MSPTYAHRATDAATLTHPSGHATADTQGGGNTSVLDNAVMEADLARDPHSPRPVTPARVAPPRNSRLHPYNDPSNYLG
jgi:hypothetical protein